jgi:hypothetical protein
MHVQHATYGHPRPPCSRRGCVFPYDLVRPGKPGPCLANTVPPCALAIFRVSLCPTAVGCTSTARAFPCVPCSD